MGSDVKKRLKRLENQAPNGPLFFEMKIDYGDGDIVSYTFDLFGKDNPSYANVLAEYERLK